MMNKKSLLVLLLNLTLLACSGSHDSSPTGDDTPNYDFSAADQWLEDFVNNEENFDGASIIVVHKDQGVLHTEGFGAHTTETIYMLASVSKVPAVSLLMALADDPALGFDIDTPIETYLPYSGDYPGITAAQLVGNTSGIPGLLRLFGGDYDTHICQYAAPGADPNSDNLQTCAQAIYQTYLDGTVAPGTAFDYGGSQWQLAGAVAEVVGGDSWANLFHKYIATPCQLEVFEFGNMLGNPAAWTGNPDSLIGQANPNIEGGGISNLGDVAILLRMHLNDGRCGDKQVVSEALARRMRVDVGSALGAQEWVGSNGRGYGMGWWVRPKEDSSEPTLFLDGGAYGSNTWIDTGREYGVFVALAQYDDLSAATYGRNRIGEELRPILDQIMDSAQ